MPRHPRPIGWKAPCDRRLATDGDSDILAGSTRLNARLSRFLVELDTRLPLHARLLQGVEQLWIGEECLSCLHGCEAVEHQNVIGIPFCLVHAFGDHAAFSLQWTDFIVNLAPCLIVFDMMQNDRCS